MTNENTTFDFTDPERLAHAEYYMRENVIPFGIEKEAEQMRKRYREFQQAHPRFAVEYPEQAKGYDAIYRSAGLIALSRMSSRDMVEVMEYDFPLSFSLEGYRIRDHIIRYLTQYIDLDLRNAEREKMVAILQKSEAVLTKTNIPRGSYELRGTVSAWITDFLRAMNTSREQKVEAFAVNKYLVSGEATRRLTDEERVRVRTLIQLFSYLMLPSDSDEGFEQSILFDGPDGKQYVYNQGVMEEVPIDPFLDELLDNDKIAAMFPDVKKARDEARNKGKHKKTTLLTADEEDDVARHAQEGSPRQNGALLAIAKSVVEQSAKDVSAEKQDRLVSAALLYLRGVRDFVGTKEFFIRPAELGGLGLDDAAAERIARLLRQEKQAREQQILEERNLSQRVFAAKAEITDNQAPTPPQSAQSFFSSGVNAEDASGQQQPQVTRQKQQVAQPPAVVVLQSPPKRAEVKRTKSPMDELATLSVDDFRAYQGDTQNRARKIAEKIELLASEGVAKKEEAKKSWHTSPLYTLYVAIGREALMTGESRGAVIEAHKRAGKPVITDEEFAAITQANQQIEKL